MKEDKKLYLIKQIKRVLLRNTPIEDIDNRNDIKSRLSYNHLIDKAISLKHEIYFKERSLLLDDALIKSVLSEKELSWISEVQPLVHLSETTNSMVPTDKDKLIFLSSLPKRTKVKAAVPKIDFDQMVSNIDPCLNGDKKFIIFDIEAHEKNKKVMLELGILEGDGDNYNVSHYIIEENKDVFNGPYVPNNKHNFNFGESIILKKEAVFEILREKLENADFIVGHGITNDFNFLHSMGFKADPTHNIDTASLSKFLDRKEGKKPQPRSIKRCLEYFEEPHENLHNAGNDCVYNYIILKRLNDFIKNNLENKKTRKQKNRP